MFAAEPEIDLAHTDITPGGVIGQRKQATTNWTWGFRYDEAVPSIPSLLDRLWCLDSQAGQERDTERCTKVDKADIAPAHGIPGPELPVDMVTQLTDAVEMTKVCQQKAKE